MKKILFLLLGILLLLPQKAEAGLKESYQFSTECYDLGIKPLDVMIRMNSMRTAMDAGDYNRAMTDAAPLNMIFSQHPSLHRFSFYRNFMFNYGILLSHVGREYEAIDVLKKAAEKFKETNGDKDYGYQLCLLWMAENYIMLGDYHVAKVYVDMVESLVPKDKHVKKKLLITQAELLKTEGNVAKAIQILESIKDRDENINGLLEAYKVAGGRRQEVVATLLKKYQNLKTIKDSDLLWLNRLAVNLAADPSTLPQAIEIGDRLIDYYTLHNLIRNSSYVTVLQNQGTYYERLGRMDEAKSYMERAMKVLTHYNNQVLPRLALLEVFSELDYKMGLYDEATAMAIENIGLNRQTLAYNLLRSVDQRNSYWDNYGRWYVSNFPKIALSVADSLASAQSYDALLAGKGMINYSDKVFGEIAAREGGEMKALWDQYVELNNEAKEETDFEKFSNIVEQRDKAFDKFARLCLDHKDFKKAFSFSWVDIAGALKPGESAVEFFEFKDEDGASHYAASVISGSKATPQMTYICKGEVLDNLNSKEVDAAMWEAVWKPLQPLLKNSKTVYFAPAGNLYTLPIEYSAPSKGSSPLYVRLTSTRNLLEREDSQRKPEDMVLYGGLTYRMTPATMQAEHSKYPKRRGLDMAYLRQGAEKNIEPLENTLVEVEEIAQLVSPVMAEEPRLLTGRAGVEESFKALSGDSPRVLHVATHGFFFPPSTAQTLPGNLNMAGGQADNRTLAMQGSGLLLAGANKAFAENEPPQDTEDGILTSREISELDLAQTDLAVLSACETGLGSISGDGVAGLQSAFKQAGVDQLLISLWKVDDMATSALMKEFYRNWMVEGKSKRKSLEAAQKFIKNNKEHPEWKNPDYWAAFVLLDSME